MKYCHDHKLFQFNIMAATRSMTQANKETSTLKTDKSAQDSPKLVYFRLFLLKLTN